MEASFGDSGHCKAQWLSREATACLAVTHFNIRDPAASAERRRRLVVFLPSMTKEEVPIGSKVMAPQSLRASMQLTIPS